MVMEDTVSVLVFAGDGGGPEFLHEEHLVGELRRHAVTRRSRLLDPVRQMAHKVKEEITLGDTDNYKHTKYSTEFSYHINSVPVYQDKKHIKNIMQTKTQHQFCIWTINASNMGYVWTVQL